MAPGMTTPPTETAYPTGLAALRSLLREAMRANLRPPPKLTVSQWAAEYAVLSKETSAQTGKFRAFKYQDGMQDAFSDPAVEMVSVMKSARVGFTKVLDHVIGYYLHQDPCPVLAVQPRVEDAEDYSKTEIAPLLRDVPVLAAIAPAARAKDGSDTILKKTLLNGSSLTLVGANSPGGFRRITARVVLFDEVDGYPVGGAGSEGDQISLGSKRSETFWNRKIGLGLTPTIKGLSQISLGSKRSETFWNRKIGLGLTPTIKGLSRIEKSFLSSDQRYFFVPCPHCGESQTLEWGGKDTPHGIKWRKDDKGKNLPETAVYVCRHNGCVIDEADKPDMIAAGEWQATKPFAGHAGFHIWAGYSLHVNASWKKLVAEWIEVKDDPLRRQTFVNLVLGLPYEDRGDKALGEVKLLERCEVFPAEVPDGVAVLTAGFDVQDDRIEVETVGWGRNEESWSIDHQVFEGDPGDPEIWKLVDAYTKRSWARGDGRKFEIRAACIDSGGHHTQQVYSFAKARLARRIWAIKGESARGGARSPVWPTKKPSSRNKQSFRPIILGVNAAKDVIRNRLHLEPPKAGEPVAGYMHFPTDRDVNYFAQLVSERSVTKELRGQKFRVWELAPGRANEALDCRVYAYAALCGLLHFGLQLNRQVDAVAPVATDEPKEAPAEQIPPGLVVQTPPLPRPPAAPAGLQIKTQGQHGRARGRFAGLIAGG